MNKFKLILSIFLFLFGLIFAITAYDLKSYSYYDPGRIVVRGGHTVTVRNDYSIIAFGIISGVSFLSSVLLLNSLNKPKD
jgi:hypothetical protein